VTAGETFLLEQLPTSSMNREAKVARTFQNIRLFSGLTVLENLLVAQHNALMQGVVFHGRRPSRPVGTTTRPPRPSRLARYWLDRIGLTACRRSCRRPALWAQRRLEIARAMCTGPELLCLDEPAAGLNPRESEELNRLLRGHPR
jgi:branched-chain amino acid transport system ATP-binding protein